MVVAKMEVDSWVSVQARREQFEQLYEDSPLVTSPQKPTPAFQPTPRPRTLSIPNKAEPSCDEFRGYQGKITQSFYHEFSCKESKFAPTKASNSNTPDVLKSGQQQNPPLKKCASTPSPGSEATHIVTPVKLSPTKVLPVFRPTPIPAERTSIEVDKTVTPPESSQGKRGRFFSHIRSRSHGNFIVKREASEERVSSAGHPKNGVTAHKENRFHKDWLTPKRKQRSTDDLLTTDDESTRRSFEGKQRLVSNVVKNMKNKETPTVLRKLSFSKNEKDLKNMKEKSVVPNKNNKPSVLTSLTGKASNLNLSNKHKQNTKDSETKANHKPTSEKPRRLTPPTSDMGKVPELIAKAVAEVASQRYSAQHRDSPTSISSDNRALDPPERPPRRRTPCPGHAPRRKGKAPTPPSYSSTPESEQSKNNTDTPTKASLDSSSSSVIRCRLKDSSSSLDNLELPSSVPPSHLVVRSCENLPDVVHTSSRPQSNILYTNLKSPSTRRDSDTKETPGKENQTNPKHTTANQVTCSNSTDENTRERSSTETEGLPGGPPPKKPPRTFAYDIYKSVSPLTPEAKNDDSKKQENLTTKPTQPIYAVPVKKSSKMTPKPPVRSKSDLSKENTKPSVAPKPPHVLAKAKRSSMVDPLSTLEKEEEETAITSEFQRQAHVRYSLRRPDEPPPPPHSSSGQDEDESKQNNSKSKLSLCSLDSQYDNAYSTVCYDKENNNGTSDHDITTSVSSTHGTAEHTSSVLPETSDYEQLTPTSAPTFCVAPSCQSGRRSSESEQPQSLTHCYNNTIQSPDVTYTHTKRSMSDETLYKGSKPGEPVYATPTFRTNNLHTDKNSQKELHYMCSILFTDEEEADAGRDRGEGRLRRNSVHGREKVCSTEAEDGSKGRSSLISAWKREFRQSCRQVQSRIKKTVAR